MQAFLARLLTVAALILLCVPAAAQTCTGAYPGSCVFQDDGVPKEFPTLGENGGTAGSLKLVGSGTGYVLIQVPTGAITSYELTLPSSAGTNAYPLITDGFGSTSWSQLALGSAVTGQLPLANGGTNANLTASAGGIFYSTGSAGAILSGTPTAQQMLQSRSSAAPAWSTATWPATTTANQLLYSSSANAVAGLATANSSVLVTSGSGVPSLATAIPAGVTATTVSNVYDSSSQLATDAFVQSALLLSIATALPSAPSTSAYVGTNGAGVAQAATATSWFDSAYCNSIGYLIVRWTGAWTCSNSVAANPVWWGADPTGSADSAAAINSALAANSYVQFPAGIFKVNSGISYTISSGTKSVTIIGAGQDNTILHWPNAAGGIKVTYADYKSSVHIGDLSLTTSISQGGSAIQLINPTSAGNPSVGANSDIYRVTMRGDDGYVLTDVWTIGLDIQNVSNVQIDSLSVLGPASTLYGTAISLVGLPSSNTYAVAFNVSKSTFNNLAYGIVYGSYIQGVTVAQTNFTGIQYGIYVPNSSTGNLTQLSVTNSQFNCSAFSVVESTLVGDTQLVNNLFIIPTAATVVQLVEANFSFSHNFVWSAGASSNAGLNVYNGAAGPMDVADNIFTGLATGVKIGSGTIGSVHDNQFISNTTPIVNSSTATTIKDNLGYNPVGASTISTGGSPYTYTAGASPETVYLAATTITNVTQGGNSILPAALGATDFTLQLGPYDAAIITYTGTLVAKKMVH
jgi:hypothetical protein